LWLARDIFPSSQIKLLGVIVHDTLNFIVHAQHASSKGMQALGSLRYLRKGLSGIISFPDLLAKADLAMPLTLLGRPSLEGLVHGSDFC
jgi:hypothetical protein